MKFDRYPFYLITSAPYDELNFLKHLQSALEKGIRLVQIRAKQLNEHDYRKLSVFLKLNLQGEENGKPLSTR